MTKSATSTQGKGNWSAIWSLFVGVTGLVTSEFLPVSLLTPIAHDLSISSGLAGQAVTASGIVAVITSLLLSPLSKNADRRYILLAFSLSLILSNMLVATATSSTMLFAGRCLLGFSVGGFWSLSSAVAIRLVPAHAVPKALSIIFAGVSLATILAAPLGSYLGNLIGWRDVFWGGAVMGLITLIWQFYAIPSLPAQTQVKFGDMFKLLQKKWLLLGMGGAIMVFAGHFTFYTYIRPFIEQGLNMTPSELSSILLAFGISSCVGTTLAGKILSHKFFTAMVTIPLILGLLAIGLVLASSHAGIEIAIIVLWGLVFGVVPVGWSTWITRTMADDAESGGGLLVAAIQFAITVGAAIGGGMFDHFGFNGLFLTAGAFLLIAAGVSRASFKLHH